MLKISSYNEKLLCILILIVWIRRGGRVVEGAALEMLFKDITLTRVRIPFSSITIFYLVV